MFENSVILSGILKIYMFLKSIYDHSMVKRIFEGIYFWLKSVFENSVVFKLLDMSNVNKDAYPKFIMLIKKCYSAVVLGLHAWYSRVVKTSKIIKWLKEVVVEKWLKNSFILSPFKPAIKDVSVEALLIGAILFAIPLLPDSLMLLSCFLVLGVYLITAIVKGNDQLHFGRVIFVVVLFALVLVFNSVLSISFKASFRDLMLHMGGISLLFVIVNSQLNDKSLRFIFHLVTCVGLILGLYALYQFITDVPMGSGWVDPTSSPDIKTRVFATFENPNLFSEYILIIFPAVFAMVFLSKRWFMKIFSLGVAGILGIAMILTYSRAGYVSLAVATGVFVVMVNAKFIVPFIALGGVGVFMLPQSIIDRMMTIISFSDSSSTYRVNLWNYTLNIISDFWNTGIGLGYLSFRMITPYYMKNMAPYHSHNTFLQITVELGILGLMVFIWLLFDLFKQSMKTVRVTRSTTKRLLTGAMIGGLVGLMVQGMAEHILYNPKIIVMFWVVVAMIIKLGIDEEGQLGNE